MAHEFETGFMGSNTAAWHGLGTVVAGQLTSAEALVAAQLDWKVEHRRLQVELPDGTWASADDKVALVRDRDNKILGYATPNYPIIQNETAFEFMDLLLGEGVRYETAGSLKGGKMVWLMAAMPEDIIIAGDAIRPYCTLVNGHDGSTALSIYDTATRCVCWNTVNLSMQEAKSRAWRTMHLGNMEERLRSAVEFLAFMATRAKALQAEAEKLLAIKVPEDTMNRLVEELYPDAGSKMARTMNAGRREQLWRAINAQDLENFRFTGWGWVNAVADYVDHKTPPKREDIRGWKENRFIEVMNGDKVLDHAHRLVLSLS